MAQLLIKKANYISGYSEAETCGHSWSVMCHGFSHCQLAVTQRQAKPNNYCYSYEQMCIPNTQCRLYEITKRSDASRQPGFFFFFSSHVPGYQANMANWLCYSETLIFTQLTKSLWRSRVLHAFCWACQTSRLTGQQMQFLEAICF